MANIIITSFFTKNGVPQTGLSPKIRIWEVEGSSQNLIIGSPSGSVQNTDGTMVEVTDGVADGFYKFDFTTALGYDINKTFLARVDGQGSLSNFERYQVVNIEPTQALDLTGIENAVWNAPSASHLIAGTMGEKISVINATTQQLAIDVLSVQGLLDLLLKYETNRTKIDPVAKTLTVYGDDCSTPLRVFQLLDSTGAPSTVDVCERKPISASDFRPVCA